ncbi:DUF1700 domain-containing protein [Cohnella lubricantis]|uniref:DUF1700 domain-containing protein n=1 Tax=Cohnella lubricantis TaxID=2163172 RepID=A0A841T9I1_9BACL|nr:DUF1700 domain-containing protein [Cohnella lubricantis]MBB6676709.1 DUF1700 domain-containing protein [Cohnella lubricantis]MBP2117755.1 putative membrane protein [Cohnella lubricantis]
MNKNEFLSALYECLAPLPEEGRREVVHYYEGCFDRGMASGHSEQQIARELGNPRMLAADALGIRYDPAPLMNAAPRRSGSGRLLAMTILLFFLNILFMIPIGAALWSALLSFGAAAVGAILAPAAFALDWLANGEYYPAKLFISIAGTGVGILMALIFIRMAKFGYRATAEYVQWNVRTWRGRN